MVLPRSMRLKGYKCFEHLYRVGSRFHSQSITIRVTKAKSNLLKHQPKSSQITGCKFAVAISSKVSKKAVKRNKLRRQLHDHLSLRFRINRPKANSWALISLKPQALYRDLSVLLEECDFLLRKSGLIS